MEATKGVRSPLAVLLALTLALGGSFSAVPLAYADPAPAATGDTASSQEEADDAGSGGGSSGENAAGSDDAQGGDLVGNGDSHTDQNTENAENPEADIVDEGAIGVQSLSEEEALDDEIELLAVDPMGDVTVDEVDELVDAVANAGESRTVMLSAAFAADMAGKNATISLNNVNGYDIVIEGGNQVFTSAGANKFFSAACPNGGSITLQNMTLSGTGASVDASGSDAGKVVLDTVAITGHAGDQAVGVSSGTTEIVNSSITNGTRAVCGTSGNAKTIEITDSVIEGNRAGCGAALYPGSNTTAILTQCTINNNVGTSGGGYAGGAIATDQASNVTLTVAQCYFEGNAAPMAGSFGGSGGAIAVYHSDKCNLTVTDSYFKGNTATANQTVRNDGGAISVFMNGAERTATATIENCVFEGNVANDDGGAILFEGVSSGSASINLTATVRNSTFIGNEGKQLSTGVAGGAIQVYSKAKVDFEYCTFYKNVAGTGAGGAIGLSGSLAGGFLPVRPTVSVANCAFVENTGAKGTNVANLAGWGGSGSSGFTNKGGNVGYDAGTALSADYSAQTVFGTAAATLQANGCSKQVGATASGPVSLPSLYIAPAVAATTGLYADGGATVSTTITDQRGVSRHDTKPDSGAVDIGWIKLLPNGGTWDTTAIGDYNDTRMLAHDADLPDASGTDTYVYLACDSKANIALPGASMFSATPDNKTLLGWGETPTTQPGDPDFHDIDDAVLGCEGAVCGVYYAVWGSEEPPEPPEPIDLNVARLYGIDRYGTSRQASTYEREASNEDTVILASGYNYNFADALTASSLSGYLDNAPIVLTANEWLSNDARAAIVDDLDVKHVIIVGSTDAINQDVEDEVNAIPSIETVERIGGIDRQETAEFIYESLGTDHSKTAIIARCCDFPDSLTISPWAAVTKSPIFLSEFGLETLTAETKEALATGGFERIIVLGDENATPQSVYEEARDAAGLTDAQMIRLGGIDRYETSAIVANWVTSQDRAADEQLTWEKPAIARGDEHPDSLTGGALQGKDRSIILLTPPTVAGEIAHSLISAHDGIITEIRFFGDEHAIALDVTKEFINALTYDKIVWKPTDDVAIDLS